MLLALGLGCGDPWLYQQKLHQALKSLEYPPLSLVRRPSQNNTDESDRLPETSSSYFVTSAVRTSAQQIIPAFLDFVSEVDGRKANGAPALPSRCLSPEPIRKLAAGVVAVVRPPLDGLATRLQGCPSWASEVRLRGSSVTMIFVPASAASKKVFCANFSTYSEKFCIFHPFFT